MNTLSGVFEKGQKRKTRRITKNCFELFQTKMLSRTKNGNIYLKTDKSVIVQPFLDQWYDSSSLFPVLFCSTFFFALFSFPQDTFLEGELKPLGTFFLVYLCMTF